MNILQLKIKSTPYTYILEWTQFHIRYIGARWAKNCHPNDLWSKYFTSSKYVRDFIEINGPPDIILVDKIFDNAKDAIEREQFLLKKYDVINNPQFLNKAMGGYYDYADPDICKKKGRKGIVRSKEWCENLSKSCKGRTSPMKGLNSSKETKEKLRISHLGHKHSDSTKEKMRKARNEYMQSEAYKEVKERQRIARTGKKLSIVNCPHCNKKGGSYPMLRWHFDNCKILKGRT